MFAPARFRPYLHKPASLEVWHGLLYVNEEDKNQIAVVDIAGRKVINEFTLKDCSEPTGLPTISQTA